MLHSAAAFMGHSWVSIEGNYRNQAVKHCDWKWLSLNNLDYKSLIMYTIWARSGGGGRRFTQKALRKSFHSDQRSVTFSPHPITFRKQLVCVFWIKLRKTSNLQKSPTIFCGASLRRRESSVTNHPWPHRGKHLVSLSSIKKFWTAFFVLTSTAML
mgnify:CR=1 FL=1